MEDFTARLGLRAALELFLFLSEHEGKLTGGATAILSQLRSYLYQHLSIEDMEDVESLLERL